MNILRRHKQAHSSGAAGRLPTDLPARLETFGRFEFDAQGSGVDAVGHPNADYPLLQSARQDPDRFLASLAAMTVPLGGWTVYGAMRLAWHFGLLKPETPREGSDVIALTALRFLRDTGAEWAQLNKDEQALWSRAAGQPW